MLRRLKVENYALIDRLELELDERLNIITGETGAGKSILLGALGLLLGNKNEGATLKDTERNCLIEGTFELANEELRDFFDRNDLDYARETTLTRQITPSGKSRSFINDTPVPLALLRELGTQLIDIHSQHQNLILGSETFRTRALDTLAGNGETLARYAAAYARLGTLRQQLAHLREEAEANRKDEEWLAFQVEELRAARLREGEQQELEQELEVLSNADRIVETLAALRNALDDEQTGILVQLKGSETALRHLSAHYPFAADTAVRLRSALEELKDVSAAAAHQSERLDADPERFEKINARLGTIYSLCQKHRAADLGELLSLQAGYEARLGSITHGDEAIAALAAECAAAEQEARALAEALREAREKAAPDFGREIASTLAQLGMPEARFTVRMAPAGELTPTGADRIDFLFSANSALAPQPADRIASGGEISRVMLALKALLARRTALPTIVFDEIDTGVSGRIADAMGRIIDSLARSMQVVDITHLPQVASKGETHFVVYKDGAGSHIRRLDTEERTTEIAKMLSGSRVTEEALAQARILLGRG
ncbi:MAG: DNA repair protein RecN [Alistipes sp.]|nr:DNA repair protein RecN [Alistipes sp.]